MDLDKILVKYCELATQAINKIRYKEIEELFTYITDDELARLFTEHPDVFGPLSGSEKEQRENTELIKAALMICIDFLSKKQIGLTEDEYNEMTNDEIIDYIGTIFDKDKINIYDIIKYLEKK